MVRPQTQAFGNRGHIMCDAGALRLSKLSASAYQMRLHLGSIPTSSDFSPGEQWKRLREPSPWRAQLIATPIAIIAGALVALLWYLLTPLREITALCERPFLLLLAFVVLSVAHELVHAAVNPMAGLSPRTILGFWPSRLLFYAHYDGELSRSRFLVLLLTPLLVISVAPLAVAAFGQITSGWTAFVSVLNTVLAGLDMFGAGLVLWQIPSTAIVRNQGWNTYWRNREPVVA